MNARCEDIDYARVELIHEYPLIASTLESLIHLLAKFYVLTCVWKTVTKTF